VESKSNNRNEINKPEKWASMLIEFFGFKNPEDLLYKLAQGHFKYMNYGMFPTEDTPDLEGYREEEVNYLELFNLSRSILGKEIDILEIGCGLGYGAQLIYKKFKPNSLLSIDRARNAILYAKNNLDNTYVDYKYDGFSENIVLDKSLDVIYTVETGGRFPMQNSFDLAYRLLKTDGIFLVANINTANELEKKREYAEKAGFELYREKDVTQQVVSYLNSEKKAEMFYSAIDNMPFYKSVIWKLFMKSVKEFARMPGSKSHELLGKKEFYYHFCFRKV
jgi:SAM-dependent methyltransferase